MTSQRGVYRIQQDRPYLRATLIVPGESPRRGHVLDLSARGLGVQLDRGTDPLVAGSEGEVVLEALVLLTPIRARVRIRQWLVHGDQSRSGLEFLEPSELEKQIPFVLRREFNRRSAPRVTVTELVPVRICPAGDDTRLDARLLDISTGGMRLHSNRDDAEQMARWRQLRVAFQLPGMPQPFCLPAEVRSRQADEVSLAFQPDLEEMRPEVYDALADFVLDRLPYSSGRARS